MAYYHFISHRIAMAPRCQELPGLISQQLLDQAEGTFQHLAGPPEVFMGKTI